MILKKQLRSVLIGIGIGCSPLAVCALLFYGTPLLVDDNPGALLSFAILALYLLSFVTLLITSIAIIVKKDSTIGGTALAILVLQFALLIVFLS
jgi:hypothetical protein